MCSLFFVCFRLVLCLFFLVFLVGQKFGWAEVDGPTILFLWYFTKFYLAKAGFSTPGSAGTRFHQFLTRFPKKDGTKSVCTTNYVSAKWSAKFGPARRVGSQGRPYDMPAMRLSSIKKVGSRPRGLPTSKFHLSTAPRATMTVTVQDSGIFFLSFFLFFVVQGGGNGISVTQMWVKKQLWQGETEHKQNEIPRSDKKKKKSSGIPPEKKREEFAPDGGVVFICGNIGSLSHEARLVITIFSMPSILIASARFGLAKQWRTFRGSSSLQFEEEKDSMVVWVWEEELPHWHDTRLQRESQ